MCELFNRINKIDDAAWLMQYGNDPACCHRFAFSENLEDGEARHLLIEYWKLMHELLWKEKHAAVVRTDMPPDAA
jgi:hypothetical protein